MDEELFSYDDIVDLITDDYYKDEFSESGIDITDKRAVVKWAAKNIDDLKDIDTFVKVHIITYLVNHLQRKVARKLLLLEDMDVMVNG